MSERIEPLTQEELRERYLAKARGELSAEDLAALDALEKTHPNLWFYVREIGQACQFLWQENVTLKAAAPAPVIAEPPAAIPTDTIGELVWLIKQSATEYLAESNDDEKGISLTTLLAHGLVLRDAMPTAARPETTAGSAPTCSVCCGEPLPSGRKCICDGIGTEWAEAHGLRVYCLELERKLEAAARASSGTRKEVTGASIQQWRADWCALEGDPISWFEFIAQRIRALAAATPAVTGAPAPMAHCSECDYAFELPTTTTAGVLWQCPKCYGHSYHCEFTVGAAAVPADEGRDCPKWELPSEAAQIEEENLAIIAAKQESNEKLRELLEELQSVTGVAGIKAVGIAIVREWRDSLAAALALRGEAGGVRT